MKVAWIVGDDFDPGLGTAVAKDDMKAVGPLWGTAKSWRKCGTDNVVCTSATTAAEQLRRAFQAVCNFYIPSALYGELGRPLGVKLFEGVLPGDFTGHSLATVFNLVPTVADTVLIVGVLMEVTTPGTDEDLTARAIRKAIAANPDTQWVVLDHFQPVDEKFKALPNLWFDTSTSVMSMLSSDPG